MKCVLKDVYRWRQNSMSMNYFVQKFQKKVIEQRIFKEFDVSRFARDHPETPIFFPEFPGGPLVVNLWATRERVGKALDVKPSEIVDLLARAVEDPSEPKLIDDAPVKNNIVHDFDLRKLPIPKYYPGDGGRYITSGVVCSEYEGKRNLSFHRMMLTGRKEFTIRLVPRDLHNMYQKAQEYGNDLDIAVAIGLCPAVLLAAATSTDYETDELTIASALREKGLGSPIEVTRLDEKLLVPAHADYILQGRITSREGDEGPFVDITGTYDHIRQQPVVEIDRILYRDDPIFHALLPGGYEHFLLMGLPRESVMKKELSKLAHVNDVRLTEGGCSWLHGVVSIKKGSDYDINALIKAAFEAHKSMKRVVIVDDDVNIYDDRQVEWAIATRFQADKDLLILEDQEGSSLDPSAHDLTSKYGFDATIPDDGFDVETFKRADLK